MTVKVMTSPAVPAAAPVAEKPEAKNAPSVTESPAENKAPFVYVSGGEGYEVPKIKLRRTNRRRNMPFGGLVIIQLALSCMAAAALLAGFTFGGEEVKDVCEKVMELFR